MTDEIKALLEKDELTELEMAVLDDFYGDADYWRSRAKMIAEIHRKAEQEYRKTHGVIPDPDWW